MTKNRISLGRLMDRVWRGPKGKAGAKLKRFCEDMPHRQRLMVVTGMLSAFVLIAFFVFGHACYRMGAKRAVFEYEVQHLHQFELPSTESASGMMKTSDIPEITLDMSDIKADAYDGTGMESED